MLENTEVLKHSSIKFNKEKVIYFDPFKIDENYNDADIIMITHEHFDHYSEEDILKVKKEDTIIVVPESMKEKPLELNFKIQNIIGVKPNNSYSIVVPIHYGEIVGSKVDAENFKELVNRRN